MKETLHADPHAEIREEVRKLCSRFPGEYWRKLDQERGYPTEFVRALTEGGNSDFMVAELPGLNHLFQKCKTCAPTEYGDLEESFSPAVLEIVGDWITRHTRSQ